MDQSSAFLLPNILTQVRNTTAEQRKRIGDRIGKSTVVEFLFLTCSYNRSLFSFTTETKILFAILTEPQLGSKIFNGLINNNSIPPQTTLGLLPVKLLGMFRFIKGKHELTVFVDGTEELPILFNSVLLMPVTWYLMTNLKMPKICWLVLSVEDSNLNLL